MPVLKSKKKTNGVSALLLTSSFSNDIMPALYIAFFNRSGGTLDFSTENLSATSGGKKVHIYTFEELEKKIQRDAAMMAFATAMSAASQSMAASMPQTTYSYGTASAYGSGGYAYGSYSGTTTTYNPAASSLAISQINANASNEIAGIAASRDMQLSSLSEILRRNTVRPGGTVGGVVQFKGADLRSGQIFKLVANVGGETHEFLFDVGK